MSVMRSWLRDSTSLRDRPERLGTMGPAGGVRNRALQVLRDLQHSVPHQHWAIHPRAQVDHHQEAAREELPPPSPATRLRDTSDMQTRGTIAKTVRGRVTHPSRVPASHSPSRASARLSRATSKRTTPSELGLSSLSPNSGVQFTARRPSSRHARQRTRRKMARRSERCAAAAYTGT